jgi:uncharacterized membrane protein YoaK (UPF0700 family)
MSSGQAGQVWAKSFLALLAALVAGAVDGIGFVVLFHLFTAHMSGNSISSAVHLAQGDGGEALHRAFPIPVFVLGVFAGAALCEALSRRGVRRVHAVVLSLEALLLLLFLACVWWAGGDRVPREPAGRFYAVACLPALAMGVQNAALRRTGAVKVRTTFISGMLTNAAEEAAACLLWRCGSRGQGEEPSVARMLFYSGIWLAYVLGAAGGVWAEARLGAAALLGPVVGLAVFVAWDVARPLRGEPDWQP